MLIYVGNLPSETSEHELSKLFGQHGKAKSVNIIRDEVSGRTMGFAFVEMPKDTEASEAIASLNRTRIGGRVVMVCETAGCTERRLSTQRPSVPVHEK